MCPVDLNSLDKGKYMSSKNIVSIKDDEYVKEYGWTKSELDIVRNLYCKGVSDDEVKVFSHICKHTKLDPFLKQIYAIPRGNAMTVQTSIDGYRLIAERTGRYSPGKETTYVEKNGDIISATAYVKKMTPDGTWHEVAATAYFKEYCGANLWKKMPHVMIAKCAEALALRKAFPAELGSIYTKEEMDQAESIKREDLNVIDVESVSVIKPKEDLFLTLQQQDELLDVFKKTNEKYQENFYKNIKQYYKAKDFSEIPKEKFDQVLKSMNLNINSQTNEALVVNV